MKHKNKLTPFCREILTKIITLRQEVGISQEQMALRLGMDQSCYSRFENGARKLDMDMVKEIADILEKQLNDFL